ncbi:nitric oxide synthase oxygenase [Nocardia terpenica]|uniref:Nitric oxide synthase oxygenase n=1 Tax=Nocardia terpenica TaxID=455432 RepID=A0A6G9Z4L3_9NOCA|nr:nitric oxide synthase oxygenase [Nocardia terpenica]
MNCPVAQLDSPAAPTRPPGWQLQRRLRECDEFFLQPELAHLPEERRLQALRELREHGVYRQTAEEILIGARLAWRNHDRCVGRKHWRSLELIDARSVTSAAELAQACWEHLRRARRGRGIRSMITIGPPAQPDGLQFRIISPQLIRYAGYRRADGRVTGDPANIALTDFARRQGWWGAGTAFDVLPLLISTPTEPVRWFDVPRGLVGEVTIEHPEYPWFVDLGLKWHAVPVVSNMDLEIGGVTYPAAPFNGWYVSTEIGARNLADTHRYDMLPTIAERLGLDTGSERTLWRDRALIELNVAVLHSYRQAGVYIVDHHTVARQFIDHVEREEAAGRPCPTDWSWVNPPMSASLTPTFHRYYDPPDPNIRPNFVRRG